YNGYLLSVATLEPRKNLERLLDAYALLSPAVQKAYPLVLIGTSGWLNHTLGTKIMQLVQTGNVRLLGYLDSSQLPFLYAGARAFAYLSVYEGYGMPIAEALCCGIPAVIANYGAMLQTGGKHAITTDVYSIACIAKALQQALDSPKIDNCDIESVVFPQDAAQRLLRILESL
ncbi:MAG: glycosyltransferase, partial [Helicobacter sp.]|nr:glycosyltransferase [Helicobacter sp.]